MNKIYSLDHVRKGIIEKKEGPVEYEDQKGIGLFYSKEEAEETLEKYKPLEGFRDFPDGFRIHEYFIDSIYNGYVNNLIGEKAPLTEKLEDVWELYYYKEYDEDGREDIELLGIFSSEEKAKDARKHLLVVLDLQDEADLLSIYKSSTKSREWGEGFFIFEYES